MMSTEISLHNVSRISAEAEHGKNSHWVELKFEFKPMFGIEPPANITVFCIDAWTADAFASAVNSVNQPRVAANTVELMQQLRDSVALCDAERA